MCFQNILPKAYITFVIRTKSKVHLKIKIAAYPAKKEIAVDKVREAIFDKN